jgi:hypothetical protein
MPSEQRVIAIVVYSGIQILDVTGLLEVFAHRALARRSGPCGQPAWVESLAARPGIVRSGGVR